MLDKPQQNRRVLVELLVLAALCCCVLVPFWKTIATGAPITKLGLLKPMDAVQDPTLCAPWCILDDLSSAMAHIPNEFFIQQQGTSELPLWNHLNGAGRPFVGEFQTLQFSIMHSLFPASWPYMYNLGILFKIFLSAVGAYSLARALRISPWTALAVGIAYALCPHCLRFTELIDNFCFYPWLALAFTWFARRPSLPRAVATGMLTAASAYNMHPETFACAAGLSATISFIAMVSPNSVGATPCVAQPKQSQLFKQLAVTNAILWIVLIAVISFCAAAPVVLPLAEFIANGSSYKFAEHQIEHIQFSDFLCSLFLPISTGSSYVGLILGLSLPLGTLVWWRRSRLLLAALVSTLLFALRPGILEPLLAERPWCFLLPEYTFYAAILLTLLCAAAGLDELLTNSIVGKKARSIAMFAAIAPCLAFLFSQLPASLHFLPRISDQYIDTNLPIAFITASILLALTWLALGSATAISNQYRTSLLAFLVLANSLILAYLIPRELGGVEAFEFKTNAITTKMQSLHARVMATGYNLFQPNTNLIYGIDDFRSTAPLYPRRYANFLKLGGGGAKFCTIPEAPSKLNHIFDLASVKYILSDRVVESSSKPQADSAAWTTQFTSPASIKIADGFCFDSASGSYDSKRRELFARADFTLQSNAHGHYACALAYCSSDGKILNSLRWLNDRIEEVGEKLAGHKYRMEFSLPVSSEQIADRSELSAVILVRDNWSKKLLGPKDGIVLGHFAVEPYPSSTTDRFVRRAELPGGLYLYENRNALPEVYLVHKIKPVHNEAESLAALANSDIDWRTTAIVEDDGSGGSQDLSTEASSAASNGSANEFARVLDRSPNSVVVLARVNTPSWLILSDTYFPGWKADVDGKTQKIYAANHMFRAVKISAGLHSINFSYTPQSFIWGCRLLGFAIAFSCVVLAFTFRRRKNQKARSLSAGEGPPFVAQRSARRAAKA